MKLSLICHLFNLEEIKVKLSLQNRPLIMILNLILNLNFYSVIILKDLLHKDLKKVKE